MCLKLLRIGLGSMWFSTTIWYLNMSSTHALIYCGTVFFWAVDYFYNDNTRTHQTCNVEKWFIEHQVNIHHLTWPTQGMDLIPINLYLGHAGNMHRIDISHATPFTVSQNSWVKKNVLFERKDIQFDNFIIKHISTFIPVKQM